MNPSKKKICKGNYKSGYFKGCDQEKYIKLYGLCSSCVSDWMNESDLGKIYLEKMLSSLRKEREKSEQDLQKGFEEKKNKNKLSNLLKSVKDTCHKYIRLRDKGKPCISCEEPWHSGFHAGHGFKAETYSTIRFNELNINGQCEGCNIHKDGNENEYMLNLPKRIGKENFDKLVELANLDKKINHKWDREELIKIRNYYNKKIKEL